jgi:hypothetical protein
LTLHVIFNYILRVLYLRYQRKELPIEKDRHGRPEFTTRASISPFGGVKRTDALMPFSRARCSNVIKTVRLDSSIIHGDGTTTAAKKGGRQSRLQAHNRSAKLAASMNAQDEYLLPFLMLPSPFFLPLLMCWQRGNVSMSNLQVLNAIPYVAEHGCKWRGLPKRFGRWHTIYTRMNHWSNSGVLDRVFIELQHTQIARVRIEAVSLESTIVKVHPDGTGALKKTDPSTNWM